ncbi:MAG: AzlC family ABC transporter permease [Gammaproteobacteria bacterium]|nr:AzlC family ABC transporter permease [Gammaproteobacteria bacterium]
MLLSIHPELLRGMRASTPLLLVIGPFGLLFGVAGTQAGLNIAEVLGFTVLVIAGASQFTAVQLLADQAPTIIALVTALAVNLRMAMYSAALTAHFGSVPLWIRLIAAYGMVDQAYALSVVEFERRPALTPMDKAAFYIGSFLTLAPCWYLSALAGVLFGNTIPASLSLDFAMPVTFIALVAPALRSLPHTVAALVSVTLALLLVDIPYSLGLLVAAIAAMCAGAGCELLLAKRR